MTLLGTSAALLGPALAFLLTRCGLDGNLAALLGGWAPETAAAQLPQFLELVQRQAPQLDVAAAFLQLFGRGTLFPDVVEPLVATKLRRLGLPPAEVHAARRSCTTDRFALLGLLNEDILPLWHIKDKQKTGADVLLGVSKLFKGLGLGAFDGDAERLRGALLQKLRALGCAPRAAERCAAPLMPSLLQAERGLLGEVLLLKTRDVGATLGRLLAMLGADAPPLFDLLHRPAIAERLLDLGLDDAMGEAVAAPAQGRRLGAAWRRCS